MPTGRTSISAANIEDGFGNKLAAGTLEILCTDDNDVPLTPTSGESGGGVVTGLSAVAITAGAIPSGLTVADTRISRPANICYRATIRDTTGLPIGVIKLIQSPVDGSPIVLDTWTPAGTSATVTVGPPGPVGAVGSASGITLIDSVTGDSYQLTIAGGSPTWTKL